MTPRRFTPQQKEIKMLEKKLIEKDVEVIVKEKRLVEVYCFEGKDYRSLGELKQELARRMSEVYEEMLDFSTNACNLVTNTNMYTFLNNARQPYNANELYGNGKLLEHLKKMEGLITIYSELQD